MKQFMGFKVGAATLKAFGTNADPTAVAPAVSPEQLGAGMIGFFAKANNTGLLIPLKAAGDFIDVKSFYIARGNALGSNPNDTNDTAEGATLSDAIDRKTLTVEKYLKADGIAKEIQLGGAANNLIGGAVTIAGASAAVTIVDTAPNIHTDWKSKTYEVFPAVGADAVTVAGALAVKIMADPDRLVDATPKNAGAAGVLSLTHRVKGKTFDAHGVEGTVTATATKTVPVPPVRQDNYPATIKELELECAGYEGVTRRGDGQLGDTLPYTQVDPSAVHFVTYMLSWERQVNRQGVPVDAKASRFLRLYLAVPTTNTGMITDIDTILTLAVNEEIAGQGDESPLMMKTEEKEAEALKKRKEEDAKKLKQEEKEREKAQREQAEQLPAEHTHREKHEQTLREIQEEKEREEKETKEREEREKAAHRDAHKH
jgi:hypothetical protein